MKVPTSDSSDCTNGAPFLARPDAAVPKSDTTKYFEAIAPPKEEPEAGAFKELTCAHCGILVSGCECPVILSRYAPPSDAAPIAMVQANADAHLHHWTEKSDDYWLQRLMQEVGELASVLAGDHSDTVEHELAQIGGIAVNWLRRLAHPEDAPEGPLRDALLAHENKVVDMTLACGEKLEHVYHMTAIVRKSREALLALAHPEDAPLDAAHRQVIAAVEKLVEKVAHHFDTAEAHKWSKHDDD